MLVQGRTTARSSRGTGSVMPGIMSYDGPLSAAALRNGLLTMNSKWMFVLTGLANAGVSAQTCTNPLPLLPITAVTGDTCTAENSLPGYGGVPSPQREVVYALTAQGVNMTAAVAHTGTPFGATMFLLPTPCSSSTDPIAIGDFNTPMAVSGLNVGATYYLVVTADPGGAASACGAYAVSLTSIPVELQSFSIE